MADTVAPIATGGGITSGYTGTTIDPSQSTLSPNFGPYVYNMLGMGEAAANLPYQPFEGERFAGPSALQTQGFGGISNLVSGGGPSQFGTATNLATQAGQAAGNVSYTPTTFSPVGVGHLTVGSEYNAPEAYQAGTFNAGFQAPQTYQAGAFTPGYNAGQFDTQLGKVGSVQDYISPYQQAVIDIQAREARRQADIARNAEQARLAKAGAYGGSRQAIMEAERQRNLSQQIGDIQAKGLQSAYDRAVEQRLKESQLGLQAQQYGEQAKQFGATTGLEAQRLGEQSRQFGAQQALNAAQLQAQFGMDAQKAQELSRQYGYGQQMTAAQLQAQFGMDAQKANQLANLQAQQANQRAAMEAQQQSEQSRQFGAKLGLEGLQQQINAAQTLGGLGTQQFGTQLQGLDALMRAGATQQQFMQQPLDFGYQQFQESMKYPYQQASFMQSLLQGLPLQARAYDTGQSEWMAALQGGLSSLALQQALLGK